MMPNKTIQKNSLNILYNTKQEQNKYDLTIRINSTIYINEIIKQLYICPF